MDRKVLEVSAWGPTMGTAPMIIYISSYNLTTKVQVTADRNMKMKLEEFMDRLNNNIDNAIAKYAN